MKCTILMVVDSVHQSGAYWRSTGPFIHMAKQYRQIDFNFKWMPHHQLRWPDIASSDIIFMHRPYDDIHYGIFSTAHDFGVPVWIDLDDHILDIPHDNDTYAVYMDPKVHDRVIKMILGAQAVSVSTAEMKRIYNRYRENKDCVLIKNAIDPNLFAYRNPDEREKMKRVLWRGSKHHQKDLLINKDAIVRACKEFKDFEFYFVGWKPWYIIEEVPNAFSVTPMEVNQFHKCLHAIHPDVIMVPLADNLFNRCKSNIAAIEGAMACGMTIAPSWDEWNIPGVETYGRSFEETLMWACETADIGQHESNVNVTWNHVLENYTLPKFSSLRMELINKLM